MRPEETDGYQGLYGEVVTEDVYRLRTITEWPDVVLDIGANIGIFARFARELFPDAFIMAIEPHRPNFDILLEHPPDPIDPHVFIHAAIGSGPVWRAAGAANGAHECYVCEGVGYPRNLLTGLSQFIPTSVPSYTLAGVPYAKRPTDRYIVKLDCEGGENHIFSDPASMKVLQGADYIAAELHFHAANRSLLPAVRKMTDDALALLAETYDCEREGPMFYARKRHEPNE